MIKESWEYAGTKLKVWVDGSKDEIYLRFYGVDIPVLPVYNVWLGYGFKVKQNECIFAGLENLFFPTDIAQNYKLYNSGDIELAQFIKTNRSLPLEVAKADDKYGCSLSLKDKLLIMVEYDYKLPIDLSDYIFFSLERLYRIAPNLYSMYAFTNENFVVGNIVRGQCWDNNRADNAKRGLFIPNSIVNYSPSHNYTLGDLCNIVRGEYKKYQSVVEGFLSDFKHYVENGITIVYGYDRRSKIPNRAYKFTKNKYDIYTCQVIRYDSPESREYKRGLVAEYER